MDKKGDKLKDNCQNVINRISKSNIITEDLRQQLINLSKNDSEIAANVMNLLYTKIGDKRFDNKSNIIVCKINISIIDNTFENICKHLNNADVGSVFTAIGTKNKLKDNYKIIACRFEFSLKENDKKQKQYTYILATKIKDSNEEKILAVVD